MGKRIWGIVTLTLLVGLLAGAQSAFPARAEATAAIPGEIPQVPVLETATDVAVSAGLQVATLLVVDPTGRVIEVWSNSGGRPANCWPGRPPAGEKGWRSPPSCRSSSSS